MGSKLAILAAQLIAITAITGGARIAAAEPTAANLMKQGIDAYKAGKYDDAATALERAYQLEHKPEALFALAQAERLGGHCDKAAPHYRTLLDQTTDLAQAKLVQNNLGLCEAKEPKKPEKLESKPEPAPPKPITITKTVVHEVRHTDVLATSLLALGMLGGGASAGLALESRATRNDADRARTLDDHNRLEDRADRDRLIAYAAAGASAAFISVAIFRWIRSGDEKTTEVAIAPSASGPTLWVSGRW